MYASRYFIHGHETEQRAVVTSQRISRQLIYIVMYKIRAHIYEQDSQPSEYSHCKHHPLHRLPYLMKMVMKRSGLQKADVCSQAQPVENLHCGMA